MARIIIEVPDTVVAGKCNRDLQHLFADALAEFVAARTPVVKYVDRRYPDTLEYAWLDRDEKILQVAGRVQLAERLHNSVLCLNVEPGGNDGE